MDVGGGDNLADLIPRRAHEATATAHGFVGRRRFAVANDRCPGLHRREPLARFAPSLDETPAHHGIFDPTRAVEIPAIRSAARAAARLVIGHAGTCPRIIRLLRFPGDDAALDVNLPRARTGAIHAVGGAHDFVVLPALPVAFLPHAIFVAQFAETIGEGFPTSRKIGEALQEMAHKPSPDSIHNRDGAGGVPNISPITGARRTSVR